jgi:hypothetical protein
VKRSAELFAFLSSDNKGAKEFRRLASTALEGLSGRLPDEDLEAAVARGKTLTLDQVVEPLLKQEGG